MHQIAPKMQHTEKLSSFAPPPTSHTSGYGPAAHVVDGANLFVVITLKAELASAVSQAEMLLFRRPQIHDVLEIEVVAGLTHSASDRVSHTIQ